MKVLLLIPALLVLAACASPDNAAPRADGKPSTTMPKVGGDRDAHGCIGSAGYQWCEHSQRCERPWSWHRHTAWPTAPRRSTRTAPRPPARRASEHDPSWLS